jgi:hypothetical protein
MAAHEQSVGRSDEWYTPKYVFEALGETFDLDVAHPGLDAKTKAGALVDWIPAKRVLSSGALEEEWTGFVWMNPPFGKRMGVVPWLEKFFAHGDGIALTPDRTPCPWWQEFSPRADAILFWRPKINFVPGPGVKSSNNGMGTCLFAAGARAVAALHRAAARGHGQVFIQQSRAA